MFFNSLENQAMQAIYQANIEEIDDNFLQGLKILFLGKRVTLVVSEINAEWNNLMLAQHHSLSAIWDNEEDEVWNNVTSS